MKIGGSVVFGKQGRSVRKIVPSPSGQYLVLIYGEGRPYYSSRVDGAMLFRRTGSTFAEVGELPVASAKLLVLDDGHCIVILADYQGVEFVRSVPSAQGVVAEARWTEVGGLSLSDPSVVLLPPGREALIGVTDRDDGHGWSEPVYTDIWRRLELPSGNRLQESSEMFGRTHLLLAPGAPWASPYDGGDAGALNRCIKSLPFRREWPRRVGPTRLLTTSRVIDVVAGKTLLGEERTESGLFREFYDLSPDENYALSSDKQGDFELWNVQNQSALQLSFSEHEGVRYALFLASGESVVGTARGDALLLSLHFEV